MSVRQQISDAIRTMESAGPIQRALMVALGVIIGLQGFRALQLLVTPTRTLSTGWDDAIPFLPATIWVYIAFFPLVVTAAKATEGQRFLTYLRQLVIAWMVGMACFALLPATMARPDPSTIDQSLYATMFRKLHAHDDAHNTFPSLHVTLAWLAAWAFPRRRWLTLIIAGAVSISTLTVKQHTLADVLGGTLLAIIILCCLPYRDREPPSLKS
jgi:membrane-associated phospholipid phosphatase